LSPAGISWHFVPHPAIPGLAARFSRGVTGGDIALGPVKRVAVAGAFGENHPSDVSWGLLRHVDIGGA
jgi:hypothetical protein